ncbi:TetR/AcrR family transcriptional regulator [Mycolicibacterium fortuitum]
MNDAHRLDLDDLVDLSYVIEGVVGRTLRPDESSRLKAAYLEAVAVTAGTTLRALGERLQRVELPQTGTVEPSSSDRILRAAVACLSGDGTAATSLRAVAEAAGVSHGSILTALIENPRLCSPKFLTCEQRSV